MPLYHIFNLFHLLKERMAILTEHHDSVLFQSMNSSFISLNEVWHIAYKIGKLD